jgi:hypothetical protein
MRWARRRTSTVAKVAIPVAVTVTVFMAIGVATGAIPGGNGVVQSRPTRDAGTGFERTLP